MSAELGPSARALLAAARQGMTPDAAVLARVRGRVGASVGAATATATAVKMSLAAKLTIAVLAVGAVAGGVAVVSSAGGATAETPVAAPMLRVVDDEDVAAPSVRERAVEAAAPAGAVEELPVVTKRIAVAPTPAPTPTPRPAIEGKIAELPKVATLAREVELVDTAMKELRAGRERSALTVVHAYTTETAGRGQLAEDAVAIEVEALCRIGDERAAARLGDFDRLWPHSAQRKRLAGACK